MLEWLVGSGVVRGMVDAAFARWAHRRAARLNATDVARTQERTLLDLVRNARHTRFGRDHGFAHVRSVADYQRQIPLRDYEAFWHQYWRPAFPHLSDATWPGPTPYLALSSGTTTGATKYIPVSRAMLASNRRAAVTGLAWFRAAHPGARLFTGRMFFLGGSTSLAAPDPAFPCTLAGDLSGIVAREVAAPLRAFAFPPLRLALLTDWDEKLDRLAREGARLSITLVAGVPSWLLALFERLRQVTGRQRITDVWPALSVVAHGGTRFDAYRPLFRRVVGEGVIFLDQYAASEGFVAAEDPRHGLLRLVPDHGVFFEFVPASELGTDHPIRHTAAEVVPGVQYAVVLTTCAGLWGYVLGDTVCFERRDPPLLRFTGRTRQTLSAFGEHLIGEEVERAVACAALATGALVVDYHVGPVFPDTPAVPGRHHFVVEFARPPRDEAAFAAAVDAELRRANEDYRAHRAGDVTLRAPELIAVPRGTFAAWMRSRGRLGGQNKVPRIDGTGTLTAELAAWVRREPAAPDFSCRRG
jgi:hypothetical protein